MAIRNSTQQLKKEFSHKLKEVSLSNECRFEPVKQEQFINWENNHNYKTTYNQMSSSLPKLVNVHFIPNYKGYVPRVKAENMFAKCYTKLANEGIRKFDEIRFSGRDQDNVKE